MTEDVDNHKRTWWLSNIRAADKAVDEAAAKLTQHIMHHGTRWLVTSDDSAFGVTFRL